MRIFIITILSLINITAVQAQFRIANNTDLGLGGNIRVTVQTTGNVIVDQDASLSNTVFIFAGGNMQIIPSGNLSVLGLGIGNGSNLTLQGDLTVTGDIVFEDGFINPGSNKLLYTGPEVLAGSDISHVRGTFWQQGSGTRSYPIASTDNTYAPFVFEGVNETDIEMGITAVKGDPAVTNIPPDIPEVSTNWYWELATNGTGNAFSGAVVTLPIQLEDEPLFQGEVAGVVLQTNPTRDVVQSLGGSAGIDIVKSRDAGTGPIFFLGTKLDVKLSIHNIISPNGDGINDYLFIENLELLGLENEIILVDRWGVVVYEATDFVNFDPITNPYDGSFDFLQPGNYVCIVKIPNREMISQTITVIRE